MEVDVEVESEQSKQAIDRLSFEKEKLKTLSLSPDEAQVHAQSPVDAAALEAEEDPVRDRGPRGHPGRAVDADLLKVFFSFSVFSFFVFFSFFVNFECSMIFSSLLLAVAWAIEPFSTLSQGSITITRSSSVPRCGD